MSATLATVGPADQKHYQEEGYVLLRGVLPDDLLASAQSLCEQWVEGYLRQWRDRGLIEDARSDLPFDRRFNTLWNDAGRPSHHRSPRAEIVRLDARTTFNMLRHPALLDAAAALLQTDELVSHGVWNVRPKCPSAKFTDTPLHQDAQYFRSQARTRVMSAWFPLHDVDENRSCLEVTPGYESGHLFDDDASTGTGFIGIRPEDARHLTRKSIAMRRGDLLCFTDLTPHGATPNRTDRMRWSIDMRFVPVATAHPDAYERGFVARAADPAEVEGYDAWRAKWPDGEDW
ncbi:MAG: phytanoyl-CoA dioxygenase family protein [Planctomycetota bacterium]